MDLSLITASDFRAMFYRDFPYLPTWDNGKTYKLDDIVYYANNGNFYKSLVGGNTAIPTDATKWVIQSDISTFDYVLDADIEKAFDEASSCFNVGIWGIEKYVRQAFLYLTAHYLIMDLRNSSQGLNSSGVFAVASRSVGSVSESYSIPQRFLNDTRFNYLTQSGYGMKYLSLLTPKMIGNVGYVIGGATPYG